MLSLRNFGMSLSVHRTAYFICIIFTYTTKHTNTEYYNRLDNKFAHWSRVDYISANFTLMFHFFIN